MPAKKGQKRKLDDRPHNEQFADAANNRLRLVRKQLDTLAKLGTARKRFPSVEQVEQVITTLHAWVDELQPALMTRHLEPEAQEEARFQPVVQA